MVIELRGEGMLRWLLCLAGVLVLTLCGCSGPEVDETAALLFETTPVSGALVSVGETVYGETPCEVRGIAAGEVYVQFFKEGYQRKYEMVRVPESGQRRVVIELAALSGFLSLESDPPHAKVYFDGVEYAGETPLVNWPVGIGEHTYELRLENYVTSTKTLVVEEDYRYSFKHVLKPLLARLQVLSRPSGATIWLNGELLDRPTPAKFTIPPGTYTVTVQTKGFLPRESTVVLAANGSEMVEVKLKEGFAPVGMVLVPAGEFVFGVENQSPDEAPKRKINLKAFYIDRFEVTNTQFQQVFRQHVFEPGMENYPVTGVAWTQAREYAVATRRRLPTEQEWEKAARGVDGREFPWGQKFEPEWCNGKKDSGSLRAGPKKVGSLREGASPYGCMDMAGNVYEWTANWYGAYEGNTKITTEYGQVYRVLRGGSFLTGQFDLRCARRHYAKMDAARSDYGFRCALDVPSQ